MIKPVLFLTILIAAIGSRAFAQTSDRVTYDIVYDVSGSIPIFDNNGNLRSLLQQMIRITENSKGRPDQIKSYADFHLYFIGGDPKNIIQGEKFLSIDAKDADKTNKILDAIEKLTASSPTQKRTHLHTALDEILKGKDNAENKNTAGGVFIFSDAQISEKDFDADPGDPERKDLQSYQNMINLRIAQIQTQMHKPVFLVQSYLLPQNTLTMIPDSTKYPNSSKEVINAGNWFWLRNSLVAKSDPEVQKEFQRFIDQANVTIVNFNRQIPVNDKVAATIKIEQLFELLRNVQSEDIDSLINKSRPAGMTDEQVNALQKIAGLAGNGEFSTNQIKEIQSAIEILAKAPKVLRDLGAGVSKELDTKLSLISDQSLNQASFPAVKADIAAVKNNQGESMQAMILNGVAKYIVERVKQEIALYFLEQVNTRSINNVDRYQEIGEYLLPNTKTIIAKPENYTDINSLRTALLKDIDQLPDNLAAHADLFGRSEGLVTLSYFYQLYQNIRQSNSLELSFEKLGKTIEERIKIAPSLVNSGADGLDRKISAMEQSILFTSRLVGYLRNHDLSKVFIDQQPDTLTKLISLLSLDAKFVSNIKDVEKLRPVLNNIYLKYQELKATTIKYQPLFDARISGKVNEFNADYVLAINDLLTRISDLMLSGSDILKLIQIDPQVAITRYITPLQARIANKTLIPVKLRKTYNFYFEMVGKTVQAIVTDPRGLNKQVDIKFISRKTEQVEIDGVKYKIRLLNYDKIVNTAAEIAFEIEELQNNSNTDFTSQAVIRSAQNTMQAYFLFRQQKYADGVNLLIPEIKTALRDRIGSDTIVLEHIEKILRIAGGVVNASSSDDIERIIAQNAVAAGGYRNKRLSQKTVYLNAYAGGAFTAYPADKRFTGALFAPVGFEFAWGNKPGNNRLRSFGLMLSIIDVGNIINYQLANHGADQTDVTSLSRAFAPGIYGTYGLSNHHPLSLLLGYQVNPARFNVGVAFDLPIFPFMQQK